MGNTNVENINNERVENQFISEIPSQTVIYLISFAFPWMPTVTSILQNISRFSLQNLEFLFSRKKWTKINGFLSCLLCLEHRDFFRLRVIICSITISKWNKYFFFIKREGKRKLCESPAEYIALFLLLLFKHINTPLKQRKKDSFDFIKYFPVEFKPFLSFRAKTRL